MFGEIFCHIVPYAQGTSVYTSTLTLTSIAIDRFFVIIYPFQPRMTIWTTAQIIATIWIFSLVATLPYGIYMANKEMYGKDFCEETWPQETFRKVTIISNNNNTVYKYVNQIRRFNHNELFDIFQSEQLHDILKKEIDS